IQGSPIDYSVVSENPSLKGKAISLSKYLDLISKQYDGIIRESGFGKMAVIPSKKFYSYVDSSKLLIREDIPEVAKDKLSDRFEYAVKGNGLDKKDMLILDILDTNKWERPVYFNFTSKSQVNFDLAGRTVQVADLYRVLPLDPEKIVEEQLVDTRKMYDNLINKASYDNMNKENIHYSENYLSFALNRRGQFNTLIRELIREGDRDTASDVLHKVIDYFPEASVPYDFTSIDLVKYAIVLDEPEVSEDISEKMYDLAEEWLTYVNDHEKLSEDLRTKLHLYTLSELTRIYHQTGDLEKATRFNNLLEKHFGA
ncbi:MAG: hypothetical protein WBA74_19385, partial [Cyclobacteriaceae bacterium]